MDHSLFLLDESVYRVRVGFGVDHHVCRATRNDLEGIAYRMRAGRTCGCRCFVRAFSVVADAHVAGG